MVVGRCAEVRAKDCWNKAGGLGQVQVSLIEGLAGCQGAEGGRLTSLEPHGLGRAGLVQLGDDAAQGTEHGPAGVDHLRLTVLLEGLWVGGQAGGVPAEVAGELAGQVGDLGGEVAQEPAGGKERVNEECQCEYEGRTDRKTTPPQPAPPPPASTFPPPYLERLGPYHSTPEEAALEACKYSCEQGSVISSQRRGEGAGSAVRTL